MVEWHALDTVLAGINTAMYGLALLLVRASGRGKGLRTTWLYSLAVIALLSTFGHHHYASGQPMTLKWIALGASMLGAVSFARHMAMVIAHSRARTPAHELVPGVWTAFAVGTGVLLAVPPINQLLHGTHAIVGHAMGSLIGVNVSIILGGLMGAHPSADPDRDRFVRTAWIGATGVLALIIADLVVAGVCKGVLRVDGTHREYQNVVRAVLMPLPALGLALSVFLGRLGTVAWRTAAGRAWRSDGSVAQLRHAPAGDASGRWPQPEGTP
jgi:nitric oxide reductase large subunit